MAKLDVDWLKVFVEIYRTKSVSRAAERLDMAQANASIALSKLRAHFGDRLFSRTSRGMEPTPHAEHVYAEVAALVERLAKVAGSRAEFDPATARRRFRIGMTDISEIVILPVVVNHLRNVAPGVQIEAESISVDSPGKLESGELDLAIGFMPQLEAGFYQQTLFKQNFVCLAANNHPRVRSAPTKRAFLAEGHIAVAATGTGHPIVDKVFAKKQIRRQIVVEVPSFLGVARIVARTELLAVVPRLLGEAFASQEGVRLLEPPVNLPAYAVKQHWHERFHADAGNAWLRKTLAALLAR